ncbi:uncharacterized protein LOC135145964 [Zophobas morio]|uniref:uncharacterized protein LOC135145964 n=1 Tax=Zophobas morio TaxID=2755281 RepID=UPI003082FF14
MEGKRLEAVQHLNAAEDALKSSFFKSPDSYTAIKELESAGFCYKLAKDHQNSKNAFLRAANLSETQKNWHHAAKYILNLYGYFCFCFVLSLRLLQEAARAALQVDKKVEAGDLLAKAGNNFYIGNSTSSATAAFEQAGKILESEDLEKAIDNYLRAFDIYEADDLYLPANNVLRYALSASLKYKDKQTTLKLFEKQIYLAKVCKQEAIFYTAVSGLIILHLSSGDFVSANKAYKNYFNSGEHRVNSLRAFCQKAIEAYEAGDATLFENCSRLSPFSLLDNQVLFKSIKVPGSHSVAKKDSAGIVSEREESDEDGIC